MRLNRRYGKWVLPITGAALIAALPFIITAMSVQWDRKSISYAALSADFISLDKRLSLPRPSASVIVEKPIFAPDRRPYVAPVEPERPVLQPQAQAPAPAPPRTVPDMKLSGMIYRESGGSIAYLLPMRGGSSQKLAVGDRLDGWAVTTIHPDRVILEQDGQIITVTKTGTDGAVAGQASRQSGRRPR